MAPAAVHGAAQRREGRAPGGRAHFLLREDLRELEAISGARAARARGIERDPSWRHTKSLGRQSEALRPTRALRNRRGSKRRDPRPPASPDSVGAAGLARGARLRAHPAKAPSCRPHRADRGASEQRGKAGGRSWTSSEAAEQIVRMTLEGSGGAASRAPARRTQRHAAGSRGELRKPEQGRLSAMLRRAVSCVFLSL
ncbi:MAG: hypothetical protein ACLT98_06290 [Eggerthellaceae bacterium]